MGMEVEQPIDPHGYDVSIEQKMSRVKVVNI